MVACLPCLRPILTVISETFDRLRKHKSTHKKGLELCMDMLPGAKPTSLMLPLLRGQSWDGDQYPAPDPSVVMELEANRPRGAELDAEAPGNHVLEIETRSPRVELEV